MTAEGSGLRSAGQGWRSPPTARKEILLPSTPNLSPVRDVRRNLYFTSGGQPGYRKAWLDEEVNRVSNRFFDDTLETLDGAYLRPRFNGYLQIPG